MAFLHSGQRPSSARACSSGRPDGKGVIMDDAGTESGALPPAPRPRRRSWLVKGTVLFVAMNALAVGALAARSAAKPNGSCGGGFSGYSGGGGGCQADLSIAVFPAPNPVAVHGRLFYLLEVTNSSPNDVGQIEV